MPDVSPGPHELRATAPHKKDHLQTVTVLAGQETRAEAALEDSPPSPGEVRENPKDGLKYVWIPSGTFMMGCSAGDRECSAEENPPHEITTIKGFWIGQTEVTVGAYKRFADESGTAMPPEPEIAGGELNRSWGNEQKPIVNVSWNDALAFCTWSGGRLPTEAEWEYAARGGSTGSWYGPLDDIAWYADNSGVNRFNSTTIWREERKKILARLRNNANQMHEVAQKRPNAFGVFDILGNVSEWVNDWFEEAYYQRSPSKDPPGPTSGGFRVVRGGSWNSNRWLLRASIRPKGTPGLKSSGIGMRCVREAAP